MKAPKRLFAVVDRHGFAESVWDENPGNGIEYVRKDIVVKMLEEITEKVNKI